MPYLREPDVCKNRYCPQPQVHAWESPLEACIKLELFSFLVELIVICEWIGKSDLNCSNLITVIVKIGGSFFS
jgi:hypothetical protein